MKKVFLALLILLVLIGGAVVALPILFKDKLVAMVTNEANKNLNAVLTVKDFKVSIFQDFPNLTVSLQGFDISGINQFENVSLVNGDDLGISVNLMQLISGDGIQVERIFMENPSVYVYVDKDGNANYDIAKESTTSETEADEVASEELKVRLKGWEINNAQFVYDDHQMNVYTDLKGLNHTGSGDFSLTQFILSTQTSATEFNLSYEGIAYLSKTKMDLEADLDIDLDKMYFAFRQNKLSLNDLELVFNGNVEMPADDIAMDLTLGSKQSSFKNLISLIPSVFMEGYESVQADGEFALDAKASGIYNETTYPSFDVALNVKNGKVKYPDLPAAVDQISLKSKVSSQGGSDLDNIIVDVSNFHADIANNPIDLSLLLTHPMSDPNIDAKLYTKLNLANLERAIPMDGYKYSGLLNANLTMKGKMSALEMEQYEKFNASGNVSVNNIILDGDSLPMKVVLDTAHLQFAPAYITLNTLKAVIEDAKLEASGSLNNYMGYVFKDQDLKGNLDLKSDFINLNAFLTEEEGPVTVTEIETTDENLTTGYVDVPANIDFTLSCNIDELLYDNLSLKEFKGQLLVKNKTVSFDNVGLKALGGDIKMNGYYATNEEKPKVAIDFSVKDLDIQQTATNFNTVAKLAPLAKSATGKYDANFSVNGNLDENMNPVWTSYTGKGLVATKNLFFENFEPINRLASKLSMDKLSKQSIADALVNFELQDGKVIVKPIETKIGDIPAKIAGYTTIEQEIDYTFNLKIPRARLGSAASNAIAGLSSKLSGDASAIGEIIDLDVFMTNTVSDPKIRTNLAGMADNLKDQVVNKAKDELNKKKQELENEAKQRLDAEKQKLQDQADEAKRKLEEEKEQARLKMEAEKKRLEEEARKKAEEEKQRLKDEARKKAKNLFGKP